jgi:hypothetical protein
LLGNECRLPLRQDQDAAGQPNPLGYGGDVGQGYKGLVERIVHVVGAGEMRQCRPVGSQDVIRHFDEINANCFRRRRPDFLEQVAVPQRCRSVSSTSGTAPRRR